MKLSKYFDLEEFLVSETAARLGINTVPTSGIHLKLERLAETMDEVREKKALELGLEPLARIIGFGVSGVKPQVMGLGPIPSTKKALRHAGITADQIDRVEFNEAFAAQVIHPSVRELGISMDKVNVNGGSLAIGHPLGATGARLVSTVAHELRRSKGRYGLATQCIGAGMGISTVIERLD